MTPPRAVVMAFRDAYRHTLEHERARSLARTHFYQESLEGIAERHQELQQELAEPRARQEMEYAAKVAVVGELFQRGDIEQAQELVELFTEAKPHLRIMDGALSHAANSYVGECTVGCGLLAPSEVDEQLIDRYATERRGDHLGEPNLALVSELGPLASVHISKDTTRPLLLPFTGPGIKGIMTAVEFDHDLDGWICRPQDVQTGIEAQVSDYALLHLDRQLLVPYFATRHNMMRWGMHNPYKS